MAVLPEAEQPEDVQPAQSDEVKFPDAKAIRKLWDEGVSRRRDVDRESWTNIAFIAGDHYAIFDPKRWRFLRPRPDDGAVRLKVNLVKTFWRSEVATILEGKPIPEVIPSSEEESDREAARVAMRILNHELARLQFDSTLRTELAEWASAAGLCYAHINWNKETKQIDVQILPHFEIVLDPAAKRTVSQAKWVIHGRVYTKEEAFELTGKQHTPETTLSPHSWNDLFSGTNSVGKQREGVLVLRMWHLPSRKYPKGFVRTVVGDEEIFETKPEFPYNYEDTEGKKRYCELPFIDFHSIRLPGRYEGQSVLVDLIPVQKDYNQSRSRMAEIRKYHSNPRVWAPEGSLDSDKETREPGEITFFRVVGPFKPEEAPPPNIPSFLFQNADQAYKEMQDIAGQHEVSKGTVPSSGLSGAAIIQLQEKDQRKVAPIIYSFEAGIARLGRYILTLVQKYWTVDRAVRVWSEGTDQTSIAYFQGADIKNQIDVQVVPGSALPQSKSKQLEDLITIWRERLVVDPNPILKTVLNLSGLPGAKDLIAQIDLDERQARREHDTVYQGGELIAEQWHNDDSHLITHYNFMKSEAYEQWPSELKAVIWEHTQQHEENKKVKLLEQQADLMAQVAGPSAAGIPTEAPNEPPI